MNAPGKRKESKTRAKIPALLRFAAVMLGVISGVLGGFAGCSFNVSAEAARSEFPPDLEPRFHSYPVDGRRFNYVSVDQPPPSAGTAAAADHANEANEANHAHAGEKPAIVFIHGSPGGWSAYLTYLRDRRLLARARLISVDRAGYGASEPGRPEPSLAMQAKYIAPILFKENRPVILVGHSYGGPVAVRLAMDYPDRVAGLVLIAASVDPGLEEWRWFNRVAEWGLVRLLLPVDWDVSNQELKALKSELEGITPRWSAIRAPVAVVHGEKDDLVPVANVEFMRKHLTNASLSVFRYPEADHFILWDDPDTIVKITMDTFKASLSARY